MRNIDKVVTRKGPLCDSSTLLTTSLVVNVIEDGSFAYIIHKKKQLAFLTFFRYPIFCLKIQTIVDLIYRILVFTCEDMKQRRKILQTNGNIKEIKMC